MPDSSKKQTFLHGAALLALATAVVKVIGALYKIPLKMIIGDLGFGYFNTAYEVYSVLLMISTAGFPVAMSRMVSEAATLGQYNRVRQVYRTARGIFVGLGLLSTLLMVVGCKFLAGFQNQPNAWFAFLCLGPCALLVCVLSSYRGFFQGQGNMIPTSVSQVLEAVFKLIVGLVVAYVLKKYTGSMAYAAGGAILGVTVSCLVSAVYLKGKFNPVYKALPVSSEATPSYRSTAKGLLAIAIPITIGSAGLQLLTVLETRFYMGQLLAQGLTEDTAGTMKGIYNFSQTIFNLPCAFIIPITVSIIPAITSALTLKNNTGVKETEESAARITGLLSLPCAIGLALLATPVMALLGGYEGENLTLASKLMFLLGVSVFPYGIIQFTNSVLQAHGKAFVPVINMLIAGVAKLFVVYILSGNPEIGILGAPIGALLCYVAIAALNLISIKLFAPQKPALIRNLLRPLLPAAIMGAAAFGTLWAMTNLLHIDSWVLLCGAPIAVGGVVYLVAAVLCKAITRADCLLLPKGEKLAKLLKL